MSEVVRLYQYKGLLSGRRAMSAEEIMAKLEISAATFKRDLAKLRDQLHMPIRFDRDLGGYVLDGGHTDTELPGMWFSQQEILALVTLQHAAGPAGPEAQAPAGSLGPAHGKARPEQPGRGEAHPHRARRQAAGGAAIV